MTILTTSNAFNFASQAFYTSFFAWTIGYLWFLAADINVGNAIVMLTGIAWFAVGTLTVAIAAIIWIAKHVRITII